MAVTTRPCILSPSQLWQHWCDKWLNYSGAWRWVCVYQLCKSTKWCNKGWRQGIAWACIREFCLPEKVLRFATWASEANFMKLLRDMKNEQYFSQIFRKQEFFLCQCCAYEGNLFLWARFWMFFCIFLTCGLGYLRKVWIMDNTVTLFFWVPTMCSESPTHFYYRG